MKPKELSPYRRIRERLCTTTPSAIGCLLLGAMLAGCSLGPLAKHATAFSQATGTVITNSENAYRGAIKLHQDVEIAAAEDAYGKESGWSPYQAFKPMITQEQLDARIKALDGLKTYAATLVELTGKPSKADASALDTAASGVGTNLEALSKTVSTDLSTVIPPSTEVSITSAITTTNANIVSTAVLALGEYLRSNRIKNSLPKITQDMDPNVKTLCELLNGDIDILRRQADVDYQHLIEGRDQLIQHPETPLNAIQRRDQVGKLIALANKQKSNDELLAKLQKALHNLYLTHHALAAAAQGNNSEGIKERISELEAAGQDLGSFYQSLPTN
jgi:hypothetical protein